MLNMKRTMSRMAFAAIAAVAVAVAPAQSETNVVTATFAEAPGAGNTFSVNLSNAGGSDVAGFAFALQYDPGQVSIVGVTNNTGQSAAKVQYTLGPETALDDSGTTAQRILTATTVENLKNADNLALIKFEKKPGFVPPFKFEVKDRATSPVIDGLQGADLENIPHTFDSSAVNR